MGWKGTVRSIQATARAIEREEKKRQRELEKRIREAEKLAELERAALEVEEFENYLEVITSVHKDVGYEWDWEEVLQSEPPEEPNKVTKRQESAKQKIDHFKPSFFVKLFNQEEKKRERLQDKLKAAIDEDLAEYTDLMEDYQDAKSEWEKLHSLAKRITDGEAAAYMEAIDEAEPFEEIPEYGSAFDATVVDKDTVDVLFRVNAEEVIPNEKKTLLKSGKLSVKSMPKTHYYELHQDYVCGCALRVARELFALLPVQRVLVTATCLLLNPATGHKEDQPILSVVMPRGNFEKLNFLMLDPSDSLVNFDHNMKFYKTRGFVPINKISTDQLGE